MQLASWPVRPSDATHLRIKLILLSISGWNLRAGASKRKKPSTSGFRCSAEQAHLLVAYYHRSLPEDAIVDFVFKGKVGTCRRGINLQGTHYANLKRDWDDLREKLADEQSAYSRRQEQIRRVHFLHFNPLNKRAAYTDVKRPGGFVVEPGEAGDEIGARTD